MSDENVKTGVGTKKILSWIVSLGRKLAQGKNQTVPPLNRIDDYEFRDPDYQQILMWAGELGMEPVQVIERLKDSAIADGPILEVRNAQLASFVWDFKLLPVQKVSWQLGLATESIGFTGKPTCEFEIRLANLKSMRCQSLCLGALDLSQGINLTELDCYSNQLTRLDMSCSPNLTKLSCSNNQITELDLTHLHNLIPLDFDFKELAELTELKRVGLLTDHWGSLISYAKLIWFESCADLRCVSDALNMSLFELRFLG